MRVLSNIETQETDLTVQDYVTIYPRLRFWHKKMRRLICIIEPPQTPRTLRVLQ